MNPTGLPELSKPLRDLNFDQKREKLKFQNFEKNSKILKNRHDYLLFSVFVLFFHLWRSFLVILDQKFGFYTQKLPPGSNSEVWKPEIS